MIQFATRVLLMAAPLVATWACKEPSSSSTAATPATTAALRWGGDAEGDDEAAPFATRRQRKNTVVQALRHLRHLSQQLREAPNGWEPIFSMAEHGAIEFADAREWCMGFLQAVDLQPDAWGSVWQEATLQPLLVLGGGLEGHAPDAAAAHEADDPAVCDKLSRAVPDAVLHLLAQPSR